MKKKLMPFLIIPVLIMSCAKPNPPLGDYAVRATYGFIPKNRFEENRLEFSQEIRGYKYENTVLRNEFGEKIRTKEELDSRIGHKLKKTDTFPSALSRGTGSVLTFPSALAAIPIVLALIPGELLISLGNRDSVNIYDNYNIGQELFKSKQFEESRQHFIGMINIVREIGFLSDVYYWIAKTYEADGNFIMAKRYYEKFLNFSESLYPPFFEKYRNEYKNDLNQLDKRFEEVENLLKKKDFL